MASVLVEPFSPWRNRRILVWNATCPDTYATLYTTFLSGELEDIANRAEVLKREKYAVILAIHHIVPVGILRGVCRGGKTATFGSRSL